MFYVLTSNLKIHYVICGMVLPYKWKKKVKYFAKEILKFSKFSQNPTQWLHCIVGTLMKW